MTTDRSRIDDWGGPDSVSVSGAVPAFDGKQQWRLLSGVVPACPIGTIVTLSNRGELLDVTRPWTGVVASIDLRTASVTLSSDHRECLIRSSSGDAVFARVADASTPVPGVVGYQPLPSQWVQPGYPAAVPGHYPVALPPELRGSNPLRYLEGTWVSAGYRSGRTRARWVEGIFVMAALACFWVLLLVVQSAAIAIRAAAGTLPTQATLDALSRSDRSATEFFGLSIIVLAIAFFAWLSRTVDVVPAIGGGTPRESPRSSVGWWFVPIVDFWKPYSVMRELWDRLSVPSRPAGGLVVGAWWLTLLGAFLVDKVATAIETSSPAPVPWSTLQVGALVEVAGSASYLVAAILGLLLVHEIQARADFRAHALGLDAKPATLPFDPATFAPAGPNAPVAASPLAPPARPLATAATAPVAGPPAMSEALRSLNELRAQGLVTDDEYMAKRSEILARL
jgi:hypothetical protein